MTETPMEDSTSVHSDDSNDINNISVLKEKLEDLINRESKHSHNYYDLHTKDSFTKLDVENLTSSCQRYEEQKKKKSELLEEYYEKLTRCEKQNKARLKERLSSVMKKLEETNFLFSEAYEDYKSDVLMNTISYLDNETEQLKKKLVEITKKLSNIEQKGKITELLMKPKSSQVTALENTITVLIESSMKRPEIEIEETASKLDSEIEKLGKKRDELRSKLKREF